ncbi:PepSY domain-containing protein [Actinomadura chibensis]|uniref:PepSY domain-containing protein n=1 Tax=Actinomadura chibensis TaxID=392828 RepID=A0A5D0NK15_9ACTN|nr:PepSY domain-containing protein [Actinomadura chibensis]TYB44820.1 PepSY domain-containing protein [Actinomadura chibensis]
MKIDARRLVTGRGLLVTVVAAGVLAGGGAATAFAASHEGSPSPSASPTGSADAPPPATAVSAAQAADAALKAVPGKVGEIELDDEHGKPVWEVDVLADGGGWRDVTVDSGSGKVLTNTADRPDTGGRDDDHGDDRDDDRGDDRGDGHGDDEGDDQAEAAALGKAAVSASGAADAALKAVPGRVTSVEFEQEHGKAYWEVDVTANGGAEHELHVDAASAKILKNETGD